MAGMTRIGSIALVCSLLLSPGPSLAAKDYKSQYEKIKKEIRRKKKALEKVKKRERSVLEEIEGLNKELYAIKRELRGQKKKMNRTRKEIAAVNREMKGISRRLDRQRVWLERKVRAMQKYGFSSFLVLSGRTDEPAASTAVMPATSLILLMTSGDIPRVVRGWRYLKRLAEYEYSLLKDYSRNLEGLKERQERLSGLLARLKAEKEELLKKEGALREKKRQKRELLASVRKEKDLFRKMLAELKASSERLRKMIEESEKTKYLQKGFSRMKRKLSWPVKGVIALPYGSYRDPEFKTPVFRNGIHIKSEEGGIVTAVYSGKVVFADWFKGYGKVVIINHGEGYHTVYANLSEIFLNKGDIINRGDAIGKVGDSGTLNAPGLYFEVRYKGRPLNPLHWLRSRKRGKG